ncbi:MAG: SDR family oxidoreductase [Thermodesulfovibrionales bacterium]|nr:SDR family oxidoreductase [Thermodesulfovibrionales bacterium]
MSRVIVFGAKSDMAREIARGLAMRGYDLYLAARGHEEIEPDVSDLSIRYGVKVSALEFDLLDYEGHKAFYEGLDEKPSGAVCAVGYLGEQKKAEKDFNEAKRIMDTNYTGCVSILNIIAGDFEAKGEGFIIGISSVAGDRGRQSNYVYGSAKAGFTVYLSGLRNRLFKSGVHVMTVKPGFVHTKMTEGMNLPPALTAEPHEVARDVLRALKKKKDVVYTRWFWRYIMLAIRHIPEAVFKRLKL